MDGTGTATGVVVGVDRSTDGTAALAWALEEGLRRGVPVTAVRAWTDLLALGYAAGVVVPGAAEQAEAAAREEAEQLVKEARTAVTGGDAVDVRVVAVRGPAAAVLAEATRTADLVVVGTRGLGALSRAVLGSVSSAVLHHAHGPVAAVPARQEPGTRLPRVVVGVDHSPASTTALALAADEAARRGAVLVPVLVREPSWSLDGRGRMSASVAQLEENERQALRDGVPADVDVQVEPEVVVGHAAQALLDLVEAQDLLVVGSRGRGGFAGLLLGSTSTSVAQHARCPVVVVRS